MVSEILIVSFEMSFFFRDFSKLFLENGVPKGTIDGDQQGTPEGILYKADGEIPVRT